MDGFQVIAHRGAPKSAPENSLEGFERALAAGATMLEMDVRATRDDAVVVIHDENLERTTNGRGPVSEYALSELRGLRLKNSEPIPTLSEVLERFGGRCQLNLDVKAKAAGPLALELVEEAGILERVLFSSLEGPSLLRLKAAHPEARVAFSCDDRRLNLLKIAESIGAEAVHPHKRLVNRRLVVDAHAIGMRVHAWIVNRRGAMRKLIDLDVDGIITERVERLRGLVPGPSGH
jgi:glycerophosphoryl diester phosphodiesterase